MCLVSCDVKCWMVSQWFSREESSGSCWQDASADKIQLFLQLLRLSSIKKKRENSKENSVTTHTYTWLGVDWKQRDGAQTVAVVFSGNLGSCQTGILFLHASSSWVASIYSQSIMIQIVIVNRIIYHKRINKPKLCADAECRLCLRVSGSYDYLLSICRTHFETLAKLLFMFCKMVTEKFIAVKFPLVTGFCSKLNLADWQWFLKWLCH